MFGHIGDGFRPTTWRELAIFTNEWRGEAFFTVNKIEAKSPFDTEHALVNHRLFVAFDMTDLISAGINFKVKPTAYAAIGTNR